MNNSVITKTIETKDIEWMYDYQKLVNQPSFDSQKIFNKNLVEDHKVKEVLTRTWACPYYN